MILDLFSNLWCIWCVAPFLLESPTSQEDAPPGWKVFTGALTCELFQSLSHTHTSTVPVAAPPWVLQEHTLTHPYRGSCKTQVAWPGGPSPVWKQALVSWLPLPGSHLAVLSLVPAHTGRTKQQFVLQSILHEALGDTILAEVCWVPWGPEYTSLPSAAHPHSNPQPLQMSVLQL